MARCVWIEQWSYECCGEPFAVGSEITWRVSPIDDATRAWIERNFGADVSDAITDLEDTHDIGRTPRSTLRGTVTSIRAVAARGRAFEMTHVEPFTVDGCLLAEVVEAG